MAAVPEYFSRGLRQCISVIRGFLFLFLFYEFNELEPRFYEPGW